MTVCRSVHLTGCPPTVTPAKVAPAVADVELRGVVGGEELVRRDGDDQIVAVGLIVDGRTRSSVVEPAMLMPSSVEGSPLTVNDRKTWR